MAHEASAVPTITILSRRDSAALKATGKAAGTGGNGDDRWRW